MTLVELLAAIGILGAIAFVLTEVLILGLKTTDGVAGRIGNSVATNALTSYFSDDAKSAEEVSADEGTCAPSGSGVVLTLTWTDQEVVKTTSYAVTPSGGTGQDVVRWACSGPAPPSSKILGHFSQDPPDSAVSFACLPTCAGAVESITLAVHNDPPPAAPQTVTIRPRSSS